MGLSDRFKKALGFTQPTLDQRVKELFRVRPKSSIYPGGATVPGTKYFSVSRDFNPDVAFTEIRRVWRKLTDSDSRRPIPKLALALRVQAQTAALFEYEAAGFPLILPYEKDGVPVSHREVLFFDYAKIAEVPSDKLTDEARTILREERELDYARFLHMMNDGINPCRAENLRVAAENGEMKWLFKSDATTYFFSVGLYREMDKPDLQKAEVVYKFEIKPRVDADEPFNVVKLETRVMVYMKPRDDKGDPQMKKEHIRMGCFARVEFYQSGQLSIQSKITRRMEGALKKEAENPNGWRFDPGYDYVESIKNTGQFFTVLRHGGKLPEAYLGKDGTFVLRK